MAPAIYHDGVERPAQMVQRRPDSDVAHTFAIVDSARRREQAYARRMPGQHRFKARGIKRDARNCQGKNRSIRLNVKEGVEPSALKIEVYKRDGLIEGVTQCESEAAGERRHTDTTA